MVASFGSIANFSWNPGELLKNFLADQTSVVGSTSREDVDPVSLADSVNDLFVNNWLACFV